MADIPNETTSVLDAIKEHFEERQWLPTVVFQDDPPEREIFVILQGQGPDDAFEFKRARWNSKLEMKITGCPVFDEATLTWTLTDGGRIQMLTPGEAPAIKVTTRRGNLRTLAGRKVVSTATDSGSAPRPSVSAPTTDSQWKRHKKVTHPQYAEFDPFSKERLSDKHARIGKALKEKYWPDGHMPVALTLFVAPLSYHDHDSVTTHYLAFASLFDGKQRVDLKLLWFVGTDFPEKERFGLKDLEVYRATKDESEPLYSNKMDFSDYGFGKDMLFSMENLGHRDYLDASIGDEKFKLMDVSVLLKASQSKPSDPNAGSSVWLD
jgi:hypothetical protein